MRKKLLHANFISLLLEIHVYQEVLRVLVSVGSFEHHLYVVYCAHVTLTHINYNARVLVLDKDHFMGFAFRLECYVWLCDY